MQQCIENQEMIAKEIGESLKGKTPIIYSSERFRALAMTWKIKINENAKTPAFGIIFQNLIIMRWLDLRILKLNFLSFCFVMRMKIRESFVGLKSFRN